jgi:hypothetical protein
MQFTIKQLATTKPLHCPTCASIVFIAKPDGAEVPGGRYWLDDGDTVGKLWNLLSDEQKKPDGWFPTLMVGRCRQCSAHYYAFFAAFMDGDFDDVDVYLLGNTSLGDETYVSCVLDAKDSPAPAEWLLRENRTEAGVLHEHLFGPFALDDTTGVIGVHGVSSCGGGRAESWDHAARVMAALWDDMRAHNRTRNAAIATASA